MKVDGVGNERTEEIAVGKQERIEQAGAARPPKLRGVAQIAHNLNKLFRFRNVTA
jgi:hypothetical protein